MKKMHNDHSMENRILLREIRNHAFEIVFLNSRLHFSSLEQLIGSNLLLHLDSKMIKSSVTKNQNGKTKFVIAFQSLWSEDLIIALRDV